MAAFQSGTWTGFTTKTGDVLNKTQLELQLRFRNGKVEGNGTDPEGYFTIEGSYNDKSPFDCKFTKTMLTDGTKTEFSGFRESKTKGIFGRWMRKSEITGTQTGDFHFVPSKEQKPEMDAAAMRKANNEKMVTQLVNMGFQKWICETAVKQTHSLEQAIEWITNNSGFLCEAPGDFTDVGGNNGGAVVEVEETLVQQLIDMGFARDKAVAALRKSHNNVEAAIEDLFSQ